MKEKILFPEDDIVEYRTNIEGWVGKIDSRFYGKEEALDRCMNSTHKKCDKCGGTVEKYSYCKPCAHKRSVERYFEMEFEEWDGETPLCLYDSDRFFWDADSIEDYLDDFDEEDCPSPEDLPLVICKPQYFHEIDVYHFWEELFPEDCDMSDYPDLNEKVEELNKFIREYRTPASWVPSNKRTTYERRK